ncbi:MAG: class I SAM-dependent methyltransferase [Myxococcota bacterium]
MAEPVQTKAPRESGVSATMGASEFAGAPPRRRISAPVLSRVIRILHRHLWTGRLGKSLFNAAGLHVLPANFYSTVPTVDEVLETFEEREETPPYLDPAVFDDAAALAFLDELLPYAAEFDPPVDDPGPSGGAQYHWNNSAFSYSDAIAYYTILRARKPRRVIEVGSGFSTLVAAAALEANGGGELICVEPHPRPFLRGHPAIAELVVSPVQALPASWFDERLDDGDVFFIDSTHTVKIGSDCLHLYLRVLPALRRRVLVHAHDIFLPFGFPPEWALDHHYYWTEQYLLMAFLLGNSSWRYRFGSHHFLRCHPDRIAALMGGRYEAGGSSFWFERID